MGEVSFRQAWARANAAFYLANAPADHFATSVQLDPAIAAALAGELARIGALHVTELGADDGRLLVQLIELCPGPVHWRAVDLRPRPAGLDSRIEWIQGDAEQVLADLPAQPGLVIAHELLDDIACEVVECDEDARPRLLIVEPGEVEGSLGPLLSDSAACRAFDVDAPAVRAWLHRWWPQLRPFGRYEVGLQREALWRHAVRAAGVAIAIDYGHVRQDRFEERAHAGFRTGYRRGRVVTPRVDGSANITAHVAFDALAATARGFTLRRQSQAVPAATWRVRAGRDFMWLRSAAPRRTA